MRTDSISRRTFIKIFGATTLLAGCAPSAQPVVSSAPSKPKGPLVWLDMDQAELDAAYNQGVWAPNRNEVLSRYKSSSEKFLTTINAPQRFAYGTASVEGLDVYVPEKPVGKIQIFIHGGAWSGGSAAEYAFVAEPFLKAGAIVVIPDFNAVQEVGGNLTVLADQVRRAVAWVYNHASQFGGNSTQIYLSGHSSGGHLAAVAMTTEWSSFNVPQDIIKGGLICSGLFDMKPVRLSARSKYIQFTDDMEQNLSPQRHLALLTMPVVVVYGTKESPEFQRQSRDFVTTAKKERKNVKRIVAENLNHFEILEIMASRDNILGKAALKQMGLL